MKISKVKVVKLHGKITRTVNFRNRINLVVGINGSGKTSIFNVIDWIFNLSIPDLCTISFESISLNVTIRGKKYRIVCKQIKDRLEITIPATKTEKWHPITAPLYVDPRELQRNSMLRRKYYTEYQKLSPDEEEMNLWEFISQLEKPTLINVERRMNHRRVISDGDDEEILRMQSQRETSPISEVRRLSHRAYLRHRNSVLKFNGELQNKVILSAFEYGSETAMERDHSERSKPLVPSSIRKRIDRLLSRGYMSQDSDPQFHSLLREKIEGYFKSIDDSNDLTRQADLGRVDNLIQHFLDFEKKAEGTYAHLRRYLETVNRFLADSEKSVVFEEKEGRLSFSYNDQPSRLIDLEHLSSGERQILILISYIAFLEGKIILIDEPEVSLHPAWQEIFLEGVEAIIPPDTQLILATHSPAIVGRNTDKLVHLDS